MPHLGPAILFVVNFNLAVLEPDVACIPLSLIFVHGHERLLPAFFETGSHAVEIDREIGITVEDKEFRAEEWQRLLQSSARAEECWPIEGIVDLYSEARAIAEITLDHFTQMSNAKHEASQSLAPEQLDLVCEEGPARNCDQRFGDF